MIAVAIMAIISAIAFPTYQNYIQSTYFNQAVLDAKACTLAVERFYTNNFTYVGSAAPAMLHHRSMGSSSMSSPW